MDVDIELLKDLLLKSKPMTRAYADQLRPILSDKTQAEGVLLRLQTENSVAAGYFSRLLENPVYYFGAVDTPVDDEPLWEHALGVLDLDSGASVQKEDANDVAVKSAESVPSDASSDQDSPSMNAMLALAMGQIPAGGDEAARNADPAVSVQKKIVAPGASIKPDSSKSAPRLAFSASEARKDVSSDNLPTDLPDAQLPGTTFTTQLPIRSTSPTYRPPFARRLLKCDEWADRRMRIEGAYDDTVSHDMNKVQAGNRLIDAWRRLATRERDGGCGADRVDLGTYTLRLIDFLLSGTSRLANNEYERLFVRF